MKNNNQKPKTRLKTIEEEVLKILQKNKEARRNNFVLYLETLKAYHIDVDNVSVTELFSGYTVPIPSFESVTRCRRKIQEQMPELADEQISSFRKSTMVSEFVQYSKTKINQKEKKVTKRK